MTKGVTKDEIFNVKRQRRTDREVKTTITKRDTVVKKLPGFFSTTKSQISGKKNNTLTLITEGSKNVRSTL